MPLYEYQCTSCRDRVEVIQKLNDPPQERCEKCGGDMKKLISAPAIQFKGSGFYKNDYASKPSESSSSGSSSASGSSESKSDSKSETKSDSKSESKPESKPDNSSTSTSSSTSKSAAD